MPVFRTLSLSQVGLHNPVDHSLDRFCLAAGIGLQMRTGGRGRLLRGNLRRRQDRDCDDQAKTSGGVMHNLFFRQLSACENDEL